MLPRCMTKARASPSGRRAATYQWFLASASRADDGNSGLQISFSPAHMPPASKTVRESQHETSELMMPEHANNQGHVFGGVILAMMDKCAAIAAFRHSRASVVTVSIDRVDFREPIHLGDLVVMKASINYVGRTSMEVGVRVEAEELLTGRRRHTNSCYLTFVAVDRNGRPIDVPAIVPETPDEIRRHAAAEQRRRRRLEEREAERLARATPR
jgi:acyl-CoA hydrolase